MIEYWLNCLRATLQSDLRAGICEAMSDSESFCRRASALLGERGFTRDADLIDPWLTDWRGRFTGKALALASPASTQEVSDLVKLAGEYGITIVPQGGNSGMCGGATPDESGRSILLSLRRMNAIHSIDVDAQQIICEAGVVLQTLHDAVEAQGLRFPLTLGGKGSATIGGLIATNAGGTQVLRHGSMNAQVLGLEAVLADGSVFSAMEPLKKDNRGFDLKQLLIGSEGTLGIVTGAVLKLSPALADRRVVWAGLPSLQGARQLLLHCQAKAGKALEGFEVVAQRTLEDVLGHLPDARAPLAEKHGWHALIELVAERGEEERLDDLTVTLLESALEAGLLEDAVIAANDTQAEAFWLLRDTISSSQREKGPAVQHDISVAVEKMPDFVDYAVPVMEAAWPGTESIAFGHLGDGNVHFHVIAPAGVDAQQWYDGDAKVISEQLYDLVVEWHGSISAEHGIGQLKLDTFGRLGDPVQLALLRQVKQALDPQGLLNPGKLVPLASPGQKP